MSSGTSLLPGQPSIHDRRQLRTKGKEEVGAPVQSVISMCPSGILKVYGGKRCVFKKERNNGKVGQDRSVRGREFQMVGAEKEKERRPFAERISGTVSRSLSRDLRFLVEI
jgi:hypothetical protein